MSVSQSNSTHTTENPLVDDDDGRGVQVGKHVDLHTGGSVYAGCREQYRNDDNQQPVMKRKIDDFVEHGGNGLMVVGMSVRDRSRCRSHFYLYGATCNNPFAGL